MDLKEYLKNVTIQQQQAEKLSLKCQGAVELLEGLIKEQESSKKNNKEKIKKEGK